MSILLEPSSCTSCSQIGEKEHPWHLEKKATERRPEPTDATWRHRFFDTIFWTTEKGGEFSGTVSASQSVGRCWSIHVELVTDACRCAVVAR